jgi:predicted phosphoribosyltransferase
MHVCYLELLAFYQDFSPVGDDEVLEIMSE